MLLIPSPIARVCEAAADPGTDLRPAAEQALAFARESQLYLEQLASTLLRSKKVAELLDQTRAELAVQAKACAALMEGNRSAAAAARSAAERLLELYHELRLAELEDKAYSPFGVVDQFIKVAMNVLDGHLPPFYVESRLPAVATLANSLEDDVTRFERFYERMPASDRIRIGLQEVQSGLGAAVEFARRTERAPLEDSLKLLAAGFQRIHDNLKELDETARVQQKRSQHLVLEELARAIELGDQGLVVATWTRVERAFYSLCSGLDSFNGFPYLDLMALEHAMAQRSVRDLGGLMTRVAPHPELALAELEGALTAAVASVELLYRRRLEELKRYETAPQFEEMRELVYRVQNGEGFREELASRIELFRRRLAEIEAGGELSELVERQTAALDLMETTPMAGWKALEADLPRLMEVTAEARKSAGLDSKPAVSTVSCFRCGTANSAERRYCSACQAVLPAVAPSSGPVEYTDISGGGAPEPAVSRDLAKLEELVRAAESGDGNPEAVVHEVDILLARAESLLNQFDQTVVPAAQTDQNVAAYAQFFEDRVQEFVEGLATMRESGGPGSLRRGFEMCRQAGGELMAMKQKLDAARTS